MKFQRNFSFDVRKPLGFLALCLVGVPGLTAAPIDNVYTAGHADIGVAYEDGDMHLHFHFGQDAVLNGNALGANPPEGFEYEAGDVTVFTPLSTAMTLGTTPYNSRLGIPNTGGTVYILPQNQDPALPFLGLATEDLEAGDWLSPLTFTLVSVDGPGEFSLWSAGTFGVLNFYFSSNDPASTVNGSNTLSLPTGTHAHYNWGFTEPGIYQVEMMVSGTHATDGFVSDTQTITFGVGVVPEPGTGLLLVVAAFVALVIFRQRPRPC